MARCLRGNRIIIDQAKRRPYGERILSSKKLGGWPKAVPTALHVRCGVNGDRNGTIGLGTVDAQEPRAGMVSGGSETEPPEGPARRRRSERGLDDLERALD